MGSLGSDVLRSVGFGGLLDDERELLLELRRCLELTALVRSRNGRSHRRGLPVPLAAGNIVGPLTVGSAVPSVPGSAA